MSILNLKFYIKIALLFSLRIAIVILVSFLNLGLEHLSLIFGYELLSILIPIDLYMVNILNKKYSNNNSVLLLFFDIISMFLIFNNSNGVLSYIIGILFLLWPIIIILFFKKDILLKVKGNTFSLISKTFFAVSIIIIINLLSSIIGTSIPQKIYCRDFFHSNIPNVKPDLFSITCFEKSDSSRVQAIFGQDKNAIYIYYSAAGEDSAKFYYLKKTNSSPLEIEKKERLIVDKSDKESSDIHVYVTKTIPTVVYHYDSRKTFLETTKELQFIASINGGYFDANRDHAGLLYLNSKMESGFTNTDKQLSAVVLIEEDIKFIKNKEFNSNMLNLKTIAFQSGPIIIKDNSILTNEIDNSMNGNGKYRRSLLGYTSENEFFIIATEKSYTLREIGERLLKAEEFKGKNISVINLDGGPSTNFYNEIDNEFFEGHYKYLPTIIGFKSTG